MMKYSDVLKRRFGFFQGNFQKRLSVCALDAAAYSDHERMSITKAMLTLLFCKEELQ